MTETLAEYLNKIFETYPTCPECKKILKTAQGFQQHLYWKHPETFWTKLVIEPFKR